MVTSTTRNRATFQNLPPKATNRSLSAFLKPSMTTLRYLCPASLLALLLCSCTATNPPRPDVAAPDLAWMFDGHIADGAPSFDVYLEVNGTPHMVVNNAETEYRELEPGEGNNGAYPQTASPPALPGGQVTVMSPTSCTREASYTSTAPCWRKAPKPPPSSGSRRSLTRCMRP